MSETDIVTVGRTLPKLASVEPANGPFSVSVTWAAGARVGRTDVVDLAPMIFTFKVFRPLRDETVPFRSVRLGEWGASIVWDGDDDLDIGADSIEEMADEIMTNADFATFLKRNNLTLDAAAAQLGIARRLVAYYAKERDIPRAIALACRYLDLTLAEAPEAPSMKDWKEAAELCRTAETDLSGNGVKMALNVISLNAEPFLRGDVTFPVCVHHVVPRGLRVRDAMNTRVSAQSWRLGSPLPEDFFERLKPGK